MCIDHSFRKNNAWLFEIHLQKLLHALNEGGKTARIVGGAVRNSLLGFPVKDIDIATSCLPCEVLARAQDLGYRCLDHAQIFGTIFVLTPSGTFEVTSLRQDIATDGRHAKVVFGEDWYVDAQRRDFTINALYMDADGCIYDPLDVMKDIRSGTIRFIGEAEKRIKEDYLRILRFFRFFAYYGIGRPDAEALKAIVKHKSGLSRLSKERIWEELKKLLLAKQPMRALRWMRQTGVLTYVIEESEKWGIDGLESLIAIEERLELSPDPLLRLAAIIPPYLERVEGLAQRLKLSASEKQRLTAWVKCPDISAFSQKNDIKKRIYDFGKIAVLDRLKLYLAYNREKETYLLYRDLYSFTLNWEAPSFPISGKDLIALGYTPGPALGKKLKLLEEYWYENAFEVSEEKLHEKLKTL